MNRTCFQKTVIFHEPLSRRSSCTRPINSNFVGIKKGITLLAIALIFSGWFNAVKAGSDPNWKANFTKEINWMKVTDAGVLVVSTDDGIYGIKPEDGTVIWKNEELKKLIVETYEPLSGTPFIIISPGAEPAKPKTGFGALTSAGISKGYVLIINSYDGTISCDTRKLGMTNLTGQYSLPDLNAVIFVGIKGVKKDKKSYTICYDFSTNSALWEKEYALEGFVAPEVIDADNIIATGTTGFSLISAKTGEVKYKKEIKFKDLVEAPKMVFNNDKSVVYYVNKKFGNAYNIKDGSALWKTPIDMDDPATHVFVDSRGIYIAVPKTINLYDFNTGEPKWGKDGIKLFDPMVNYIFTTSGLGIQMGEDGKYSVNLLNYETGKPLVKKALKLKAPAVDLRMVSKGLLYRSSLELNILDAETGAPSFAKSIKFKESVIAIDKGDNTYIFSGTQFYIFNNQTCEYTTKTITKTFEGSEIPSGIELRDAGILLKSDQNLSMYDLEGNLIFHVYNKAPGISTGAKFLLGAVSVAATATAVKSAASSGFEQGLNGGVSTQNSRSNKAIADGMGGVASAGFKAMGKRFNASKEADGFVTMLTQLKDGVGVVKVNKDNGKIENEVVFKIKEPVYEIDDLGKKLYFKSGKTELSGFTF
jgi:hypothetical protein